MQYIYNVSRSYKLIRHWGRAQRADISQTTFSYVLTFSLLKIAVFRFELHPFVPRVKLEVSVRFRIWMLITARWLETLQRANRGVETIRSFCHFFLQKIWVEIRHSLHLCSNIGVETTHIFQRPEKGGSKWRSICSNHHIVSTFPGGVFCYKGLRDLISQRHI